MLGVRGTDGPPPHGTLARRGPEADGTRRKVTAAPQGGAERNTERRTESCPARPTASAAGGGRGKAPHGAALGDPIPRENHLTGRRARRPPSPPTTKTYE